LDEVHLVTAVHRIAKASDGAVERGSSTMAQVFQRISSLLNSMKPRHLANIAWAFSRLNYENQPLLTAISAQAIPNITLFRPPELASTAWSCSALRFRDSPLRAAIAAAAIPSITQFDPQGMSGTAWAMSSLGFQHDPLREAISSASLPRSSDFQA